MTQDANHRLTNVRHRLPDRQIPTLAGDAMASVRATDRRAPIVVLLHGAGCAACSAYAARLAEARESIAEWDGRVVLVLDAPPAEDVRGTWRSSPFPVLVDEETRLATSLEVAAPAVVVADQWGEIHSMEPAGDEHRFPDPGELADWAKFLAIQCPECEGESL